MKKLLATGAITGLLLTGCTPAYAESDRVAESVEYVSVPVGDVSNSIPEVADALESYDMRVIVNDTLTELLDASATYETSFEFERDLLVCEQLHVTELDPSQENYGDDPEAEPLSDCINLTISAHEMYAE